MLAAYLEIDAGSLASHNVDSVAIEFIVPTLWLKENRVDDRSVVLFRLVDRIWTPLTTRLVDRTEDLVSYEALSPGLSQFAVTKYGISGGTSIDVRLRNEAWWTGFFTKTVSGSFSRDMGGVYAGRKDSNTYRGYMKFDISKVPDYVSVIGVALHAYTALSSSSHGLYAAPCLLLPGTSSPSGHEPPEHLMRPEGEGRTLRRVPR